MGLPLWFAKILTRGITKKLDLQEGPMQENKPFWKSKGVLTGIVTVLVSTYELSRVALAPQFGQVWPPIPPMVYTVLGALGIYSRVVATQTIK